MIPIDVGDKNSFYMMTFGNDSKRPKIFDIIKINGRAVGEVIKNTSNLTTHAAGQKTSFLLAELAKGDSIDNDFSRTSLIFARDIETSALIKIRTDFDAQITNSSNSLEIDRFSGVSGFPFLCKEMETLSPVGRCLGSDGRPVIWVRKWLEEFNGVQLSQLMLKWISEANADNFILDLRGNTGGSAEQVTKFMCGLQNESIARTTAGVFFAFFPLPRSIGTGSESFETLSLLQNSKNGDLLKSALYIGGFDSIRVNPLNRFGLEKKGSCGGNKKVPRFEVLTNGTEFSANELFLWIASHHKDSFFIRGAQTMGGSGSPAVWTLPKTQTKLRITFARMDNESHQEIIEGVGVLPDERIDFVNKLELEDYLKKILQLKI
jgi:hypothetical protein